MGNQTATSKAMTDVLNEAITNVMMESSNKCAQNTSSIQTINLKGLKTRGCGKVKISDINQESMQAVNFSCSTDATNESSLLSSFANKLDQASNAAVSGLGGALNSQSNSETIANIKNKIQNNINMKTMSECIANTVAEQTQNYENLEFDCKEGLPGYCDMGCAPGYQCDMSKCETGFELSKLNQNLVQQAAATCTAKAENLTKIINEASSEIKQTSEATTKGLDPTMMSLMSALPSIISVCIVLSILYFLMQGGDEKIVNIAQGVKGL
jgi:hypothetical protein